MAIEWTQGRATWKAKFDQEGDLPALPPEVIRVDSGRHWAIYKTPVDWTPPCWQNADQYIPGVGIRRAQAEYDAGNERHRLGQKDPRSAAMEDGQPAAPKTKRTDYEQSPQYQELVRDVASGDKSIGEGISEAYESGVTAGSQKEAGP